MFNNPKHNSRIFFVLLLLIPNLLLLNIISLSIITYQVGLNSKTLNLHNSALPLQGKKIGWVKTHGEGDPSNYYTITLNDAQGMGASLDNITTEINASLLNSFDILIVDVQGANWTSSELTDLYSWVQNGGSLYIWGDYGAARINVSAKFNVFYNDTQPKFGFLTINKQYPILQGINTIYADMPIASIDIQKSRSDLMVIAWASDNAPIIVSLQENKGRILWVVDVVGTIEDNYITLFDNHLFANNSWLWLGGILGNEYIYNPPPPHPWWLMLLNEKPTEFYSNWIFLTIVVSSVATFSIIIIYYLKKRK